MRAWRALRPGPIETNPMTFGTEPIPVPGSGEILVAVEVCGVCRTDLHVTEGDLAVHRRAVIPGHEIVGRIVAFGADTVSELVVGQWIGIPWLRSTCGTCKFCISGRENLCPHSQYTGWDADGGYAEYASVPAQYALALPSGYELAELASLLCAGIIGYRALDRAELPTNRRLGIYGFGRSAHLVAQIALVRGATVHVMTRDADARDLATALGAASVQDTYASPPERLDSAIIFAPIGDIVPAALTALEPGGILSLAGIHTSDIPSLDHQRHLFHEKQIRSVEANTRGDARAFLAFAGEHHLDVRTTSYPLDKADEALRDLKHGCFPGAAVLDIQGE